MQIEFNPLWIVVVLNFASLFGMGSIEPWIWGLNWLCIASILSIQMSALIFPLKIKKTNFEPQLNFSSFACPVLLTITAGITGWIYISIGYCITIILGYILCLRVKYFVRQHQRELNTLKTNLQKSLDKVAKACKLPKQ